MCGVLLAAGLPVVLADGMADGMADELAHALARMFWLFVPLLCVATLLAVYRVPLSPAPHRSDHTVASTAVWRSPRFRRLLFTYGINGVAAAIPATLVLFYVSDVLQSGAWSGVFLLLYFLAGALALPFWVSLAKRVGRLAAWRRAMLLAMAGFAVTPFLSAGPTGLGTFACVCVACGIALGADLTMPPALFAEHVAQQGQGATSYGWWAATSKLTLALAAGSALPLVSWLGYVPGQGGFTALAWVYGGLPLLLKGVSLWSLLQARAQSDLQTLDQGVPA